MIHSVSQHLTEGKTLLREQEKGPYEKRLTVGSLFLKDFQEPSQEEFFNRSELATFIDEKCVRYRREKNDNCLHVFRII